MKKTIYLIDAMGFIFRAYYAVADLSNSKGLPTNAIFGFISTMKRVLQEQNPEYIGVCFDRKEKTIRKEKYEEYKANRGEMPEDLAEQLPYIRQYIEAENIPIFDEPGYEADDIIGTLAKQAVKKDFNVIIVTTDKDMLQLVDQNIKVLDVFKDNLLYTPKTIKEKYDGLTPNQIIDMLALMGDSSDNIPGVPGIGKVNAVKLLSHFGSIEKIYKNIEKLDSVKGLRQSVITSLKENKELADLSHDLVTIMTNAPIEFKASNLKTNEPNEEKLFELYKELEFTRLLNQVSAPEKESKKSKKTSYSTVKTKKDFDSLLKALSKTKEFSIDTETTAKDPHSAKLIGISISKKAEEGFYIPVVPHPDEEKVLSLTEVRKGLSPIFENENIKKWGQNIKYDIIVLKRHGFTLNGVNFDTMIASYLLNAGARNHDLDSLSLEYLDIKKVAYSDLVGTGKNQVTLDQVELEKVGHYACEDADCVFQLVSILESAIKKNKLDKLFNEVEMPLVSVLSCVESNGLKLDTKLLKSLSKKAEKELADLEKQIFDEAGEEFNINSPKQVGHILFEVLDLPVIKKTKTGYSTDVSVLEKLAEEYEIPELLLQYREAAKLKSTYLDALPELVNEETSLLHTSFNQAVTTTGRLSSSEPNLQNIPIKTESGRRVREAFIPREKTNEILAADYSQIELRILAHLSQDKNLLKAFQKDIDVHSYTASILYDTEIDEVTKEMRNAGKTINFSVIYGKTAYGLSQDLGMTVNTASDFIKEYFKRYSGVKKYLDETKETARKRGFTETILRRRTYFPEINSKNAMRRQFAERAAVNAPIQGSSADLIKVAMNRIQSELEKKKLETKMILQVHDELVFDVPKKEKKQVEELVRDGMENAMELSIPLTVGLSFAENWALAK